MSDMLSGTLALVGSGEYTPAMDETDAALLATLGGAAGRVALLPTASALEPGQPERWNRMGETHFQRLGASPTPLLLLTRADADDPAMVAALQDQNFFYFSGGSPDHCIETLHGTAAWQTIVNAHQRGAVLAGCSAGAMMLAGYTASVRAMRNGEPPRWRTALGILPRLAVLPHFDRMRLFVGEAGFEALLAALPTGVTLVGIDEDTALVRLPASSGQRWQVLGRQSVAMFRGNGDATIYRAGETLADLETG
ncbi:MAG: Type 1 glutamine amidotransferase-like domain-containing protein [Chloroflexaceae bacterium]|nr:Type 1 glutamine amidotransferase-like domain-containing protein [Chloroflexaceae bacterium]